MEFDVVCGAIFHTRHLPQENPMSSFQAKIQKKNIIQCISFNNLATNFEKEIGSWKIEKAWNWKKR